MVMHQKKFFIFGSSGFIGSHFSGFIKESSKGIGIPFDLINDVEKQDVREPIVLSGGFSKEDVILNLAAVHRTPGHNDYEYFETNIKGAENVCKFAEEKGINTIVFTSSIAPYGASESLKKESTLPTPNTPYGISKLIAEHIHRTWQARDPENRKLVILRPGVVFGMKENGNFTRLYKALSKGLFFYPGRKDTIKACIYVKDLVEVTFEILDSFDYGVRLYNLTYEPAPTISEIVEQLAVNTNVKVAKILINAGILKVGAKVIGFFGGKKIGIHPDRVKKLMISTNISGEKIQSEGFQFKYGLDGGIKDWFHDCGNNELY
jgi:nucleoside-diphosphate-sugar epimerase